MNHGRPTVVAVEVFVDYRTAILTVPPRALAAPGVYYYQRLKGQRNYCLDSRLS